MVYSGGYAYMITRQRGYYQSLLKKYQNEKSWAISDIEKVTTFAFPLKIGRISTEAFHNTNFIKQTKEFLPCGKCSPPSVGIIRP